MISTLLELTELVEIFPTPNISLILSSNFESTFVLFIIIVFAVLVVLLDFEIVYPKPGL